jgi:Tfp pilus assembly protein PilN
MLNLARRPFVNRRPLRRLSVLFWVGAVALGSINLVLFWGYQSGSSDARETLRALQEEQSTEIEGLEALRAEFRKFNLEVQNEQVMFLNERLRERAFPWSRLFADLEEVLPYAVRIETLAPRIEMGRDQARSRSRNNSAAAPTDPSTKWIALEFSGKARSPEELLLLVEQLFAHPAFASPDLSSESTTSQGETQFRLAVSYRVPSPTASELPNEADEPEGVDALGLDAEGPSQQTLALPPDGQPRGESETPSILSSGAAGGGSSGGVGVMPGTPRATSEVVRVPVQSSRTEPDSPGGTGGSDDEVVPLRADPRPDAQAPGGVPFVAPAQQVTLRETQTGPAPDPVSGGRRRITPESLPESGRNQTSGDREATPNSPDRRPDRGPGNDRRDRFPVKDASGTGGGR